MPITRNTRELATNAAYSQNASTASLSLTENTPRELPSIMPAVSVASTPDK